MINFDEKHIDRIKEAIASLLAGGNPDLIEFPADYPENNTKQLANSVNTFVSEYQSFQSFLFALSRGDLDYKPPRGRMALLDCAKNLQANLRHLTWKTQQVAKGDFSPRLDFMGEFSKNFNIMVEQLASNREEMIYKNQQLIAENAARQQAEAELTAHKLHLEELVAERTKVLSETERMLQESQRIARLGAFVLDIPAGIFWTSDVMEELHGIDKAYEHSVAGWAALVHPEDRAMMMDFLLNEVIKRGQPCDKEYRIVRFNDNVTRWLHVLGKLEIDANGRPIRLQGTSQDITERKRAEQAFQLSRERLEEAQKIANIGNWEANLSTGELYWSQIIFNIFGFDTQSFKPSVKAFYDAVHPDDLDLVIESEKRSEQTNVHDVVHRIIRPNGEIRFVHERAFRHTDNLGKPIILRGTVQDITERKRAEAEKEELEAQNRKLQKAESLGCMAGAIAHHFNNQLHAVIGNLEIAIASLPRGPNIPDNLNEAMKASLKAAEVSSLMLTYLGKTPGKDEPIDLSEACRKSLIMLQAASPKGMLFNVDFPSSGPVILANANQIQQMLSNLVINAWEAAGKNEGAITLTIKTVSQANIPVLNRFPIGWQPKESVYACLEVADMGCGIPNRDIEKLFDPFFTTKFTGRGLGLPVIMGIVGAHGGGITVESEPGLRTVFRIFIPVWAEEIPYVPVMPETMNTTKAEKYSKVEGGGTVLVVEDEVQVRKIATIMLTHLGYTVLEAKDGVEAVEVFKQNKDKIRCVLSDLTMPRMGGWDTLAALRKLSPDIPVVMSSGYDEAQVLANEHSERPNAFLGKPYQLKDLNDAIHRVLANRDLRLV